MDDCTKKDNSLWKKGPLPEDTFQWGGVVLFEEGKPAEGGFMFADFQGDHVIVTGDDGKMSKKVYAQEIAFYNNSLTYPFEESK